MNDNFDSNEGKTMSGPFLVVCRGELMYADNDGSGQIRKISEITCKELAELQLWCYGHEDQINLLKYVNKEANRRYKITSAYEESRESPLTKEMVIAGKEKMIALDKANREYAYQQYNEIKDSNEHT